VSINKRTTLQASQYDKIIKENLEITLPVIIRDILGLDICESVELPDDIQHTKERIPDALKRITDSDGQTYVLHLEFQRADEKNMVYRMAEYCVMLVRKYNLPVKQYLIFLKDTIPAMSNFIDTEHLKYDFALIRLIDASYKLFLKSDNPEIKMLGILADFEGRNTYDVVKRIVDEIHDSSKDNLNKSRYFKQLRILAQLRLGIDKEILKAMEGISSFFKIENDLWYQQGEKKGKIEGERKGKIQGKEEGKKELAYAVVENLLTEFSFSDEEAARVAGVPVGYVRELREKLKKK
jgi:predicted transposase/invertase (TIGR01784 family)